MPDPGKPQTVVNCTSVKDYFRQQVTNAITDVDIDVSEETQAYLVNLLTFYSRTDHFFEHTPEGLGLRPLALVYGEALSARSRIEQAVGLRRVGDVAMFIAGVFRYSLRRKPVNVDYYIAIGGNAYEHLSVACDRAGEQAGTVFMELGTKFALLARAMARAFEQDLDRNENLLALYERWRQTGSVSCAHRLQEAGIHTGRASALAH